MLRALLYIWMSLVTLVSYAQNGQPEWSGPLEMVKEDPKRVISDLSTTIHEVSKIQLSWKITGELPDFLIIERSENGSVYETVTVINKLTVLPSYVWTDEAPGKGKVFYRIRYAYEEGQMLYSKTVSYAVPGLASFKFYPNPVDHLLIVRCSDASMDVQILDGTGKIRISEPRVQGIRTINVSSLEKGIYLIRFSHKLTNVISQEKLIKN